MHLPSGAIDFLRNAMHLAALAMFAGFLVMGLRVARSEGPGRRRAINQFLAYVLCGHAAVAIAQRDLWPFSTYPMMSVVSTDRSALHTMVAARAVDRRGREWLVDDLAWSPLYPPSTLAWFDLGWAHSTPSERSEVMRFLLARAEAARGRKAAGNRYIGNRAILGPFAAPDTNLYWEAPPSPEPFRGIRIYRVAWNPQQFIRDPNRTSKTLLHQFHE
jgi:hypothetical protein